MTKPSASESCVLSGELILSLFEPDDIADLLALISGVRPDRSTLDDEELGEWLAATLARPGALDVARSLPLEGKLADLLARASALLEDPEEDTAPRLHDREEDTAPRLRDREDITQPEVDLPGGHTDPHAAVLSIPASGPVQREVTDVGVVVHELTAPGPTLGPVTPPPEIAPQAHPRMRLYLGILIGELVLCACACAGLLFGGQDEPSPELAGAADSRGVEADLSATIQAGARVPERDPALGDLAPEPPVEASMGGLRAMLRGQPTGMEYAALPDSLDMRFIELTAGEFTMGSGAQGGDRVAHERPAHRVRVGSFWLAASEVSVAQWYSLHGRDVPASAPPRDAMGGVSWCDAVRFANLLSEKEDLLPFYAATDGCEASGTVGLTALGGGYRLPTEAEWEYAARAGRLDLPSASIPCSDARHSASATGNSWGFEGMNGVVWEWAWESKYRYTDRPRVDALGPSEGSEKVIRGGSWAASDIECSVTSRGTAELQVRGEDLGFRLAR